MSHVKKSIITVTCRLCEQTIVSLRRHDYVTCKCRAVSVDGGFENSRIIGEPINYTVTEVAAVKVTLEFTDYILDASVGLVKCTESV